MTMIELHESIQAVVKETKPVWTFLVCILFSYFSKCDRGKIQKAHSCLGRRAFLIIVACFILTVRHLNRLKTWHLTSPSVRPRSGMGDGLCSYKRYSPWSKSHVVIDVTGIQDQMQPLW